jgi:hypothetical protein
VQFKAGSVVRQGTPEDSAIWLRLVYEGKGESARHYVEAIRLDRIERVPGYNAYTDALAALAADPTNKRLLENVAALERADHDRSFLRNHLLLHGALRKDPDAIAGGTAKSGDFTHWHHERFDYDPTRAVDDFQWYLTPPSAAKGAGPPRPNGLAVLDANGRPVASGSGRDRLEALGRRLGRPYTPAPAA